MKMKSKNDDYAGKREFARKAFEVASFLVGMDSVRELSTDGNWRHAFLNEKISEARALLALESPTEEQIDHMFFECLAICSHVTGMSLRFHMDVIEGRIGPKEAE